MPRETILAEIQNRQFGNLGPGPMTTCRSLTWIYRRDAAGEFRAEFPASDVLLGLVVVKKTYLLFRVGGKVVMRGLVERIQRTMDGKGRQTVVISGRDQLGALSEQTVGNLEMVATTDLDEVNAAAVRPNETFSYEGYSTTATPYSGVFTGESPLSAYIKIANTLGEHFRAPIDGNLAVHWLRTDTPDAPIRLVASGGSLLHENPDVAIIEDVESDQDASGLHNIIYPFGAGNGNARITLEHATLAMPSGFTMFAADNFIRSDDGLASNLQMGIQKTWSSIGLTEAPYHIKMTADEATGATLLHIDFLEVDIPDGTLLDLNGLGTDFVEMSTSAAAHDNVLNVVATTFDIAETDVLFFTDPAVAEIAANQLAQAAVTYLQRVCLVEHMIAYKLTVRGLPDTVTVGMKIPVSSQAPGYNINEDLIILEITRSVTKSGRTPAVLKVTPAEWLDMGESAVLAATLEQTRVYQALNQPVDYSIISNPPAIPANFVDLGDVPSSYAGSAGYVLKVNVTEDGVEFDVEAGALVDSVNSQTGAVVLDTGDIAESGNLYYTAERARDDIGTALTEGAGIDITVDDAGNIITIASTITQYADELAQDAVGTIFVDSSSIDFTYSDATPSITGVVIDEYIQDLVGAMVSGNTETLIVVTYQDSDGTLDFEITDAELTALAGLVSAADRLPYFTGSGTASLATFTSFGRSLVDDADAAAGRTTLGVVIGTNVQAFDATLTSIAGLGTAADKIAYTTGVDTWAETALTSFIRTLLDDADQATARATLGVSDENIQDMIGAFWVDSSSVDVTYNDAGNSISAAVIDEYIQDIVGAQAVDSATIDFTYNDGAGTLSAAVIQAALDHGSIGGLSDDDHAQYALLAGRAGGQTLTGDTNSGGNLLLNSTTHAAKGAVRLNGVIDVVIASPTRVLQLLTTSGALKLVGSSDNLDGPFINIIGPSVGGAGGSILIASNEDGAEGDIVFQRIAHPGGGRVTTEMGRIRKSDDTLAMVGGVEADFINFGGDDLNIYDEGTWTPVLRFGAASVGITYTIQTGTYTRIGNRVYCTLILTLSSKGSSVGSADISGLPFTVGQSAVNTARWSSMATSYINMWVVPSAAGTVIAIRALTAASASAGVAIANTDFNNNSNITAEFAYEV